MRAMRALLRASLLPTVLLALGARSAFAQAPAAPPPGTAPPPASSSSLSAGGLAPPPALEAAPPPGAAPATPAGTEAELAKADKEDSGRGLEFVWLGGEVGVMHLGLGTFKNDAVVDPLSMDTKQTGLVVGAGAGFRLVFLTLGARFRYAPLPDAKLWTLAAEAGLHAPLGALEPYGTLALGYVSVGSLAGNDSAALHGFDARLGGGLDYYLTNMFSVGVNAGVELMVLSRNASACLPGSSSSPVYCVDGSSVGGAVTATAVAGLHF
jgi:hypothetical protein